MAVLIGLALGYWTVGAGSSHRSDGSASLVAEEAQLAIHWVGVAAAPDSARLVQVPPALPTPDGATTAVPERLAGTVSEVALTEMLKARFEGRTIEGTPRGVVTVQDLRVRLQKPYILTEANIKIGLLTIPVSFSATVAIQDGRPLITVETAKLATMVAPEEIRARLERFVQRFTDEMLPAEQVRLTSLTVFDGELLATGVRIQAGGLT